MATARETPPQSHLRTLISGSHILHYHQVLDAYGHLSVRHPEKPEIFVMPRNIAPGTLSNEADLVEYYISDASNVHENSPAGYAERHIHAEIYKQYPAVQSVVHSHASAVIPYTISSVPLRPCFHLAGFLGSSTPNFDISEHYRESDTRDLLVRNSHLGSALASCLSKSGSDKPDHYVALMRGHGFTAVGGSIEECVLRAIYTRENALIQTVSLTTHTAYFNGASKVGEIRYLTPEEYQPTTNMTKWSYLRPWNLWLKEVEANGLYVNNATKTT